MAKMIGLRRAKNFSRANVSMISEFVGQTILAWRVTTTEPSLYTIRG